ncbi:hypothetical protein LC087_08940 [Bacillus carboniphilus]|uniref:Radical SAM protein n=1 Tax=Bacillus carboniphilus TaxID=86663 RepID=A0ABY9JXQ9_9BACI|nr:hypothetical protein [Bacillus carboniphilus]WLR44181.1 hypothetical protein LC087_08940 [Bacillus carboniphilus]
MKGFIYNQRLEIEIPDHKLLERIDSEASLLRWEQIRGAIPDKIKQFEQAINQKQEQLNVEADFLHSCQLNDDIAELASIINDLWIWYRFEIVKKSASARLATNDEER